MNSSYPDYNLIAQQVNDGEISFWMEKHSVWIPGRFMYVGLRQQHTGIETQFALITAQFRNEARQAIAQTRYDQLKLAYDADQAVARAAREAAAKKLAEDALEKQKRDKVLLEQRHKEHEEWKIQEQLKQKKEEEEHIKAIEAINQKELASRDKIIEEFKKSIEEYKNALTETKNAIDFQNLCNEYIALSQKNKKLLEMLQHFMQHPVDLPLIRAAMLGDLERVKAALRLGANINAVDMRLETALHKACATDDLEMVNYLLLRGCDTKVKNLKGKVAMELTSSNDIIRLISELERKNNSAPIKCASVSNNASAFFAANNDISNDAALRLFGSLQRTNN